MACAKLDILKMQRICFINSPLKGYSETAVPQRQPNFLRKWSRRASLQIYALPPSEEAKQGSPPFVNSFIFFH
ncbi:hypothetical protein V6N13_134714 [Hibiscus sabdariffa]